MDEFEIAYYLDRQQLLFLLSLIDRRPVIGLPPVEETEDWQKVSLTLLRDERLYYQDGRLVMDKNLGVLLLAMKDAQQVCAIYGKYPEPVSNVLYCGKRPVLLELLPDGKLRLRQAKEAELKQLLTEALMPASPMPEALLETLPWDETLRACLAEWERRDIPLTAPVSPWVQMKEVRGVLDCRMPDGLVRWIWIDDTAAGLIVRQDEHGTGSALDTASQRQTLLRELRLEA